MQYEDHIFANLVINASNSSIVMPSVFAIDSSSMTPKPFDRDVFEERAAIMELDGGLSRDEAERLAAMAQGFQLEDVRRWIEIQDNVLEYGAHEGN